jgi:diguanylate cyclase (GGDEF)-like protein
MNISGDVALIFAVPLLFAAALTVVWLLLRQRAESARERELQLQHTERERQRMARMLESISDGFVAFDRQWRLSYANGEAGRLLGALFERLSQTPDGAQELPARVRHRQFRLVVHEHMPDEGGGARVIVDRWFETHSHPWEEGVSVYLHDNTERKLQEERVRVSSLVDDLTGLYNRRGFLTLAEQHLKLAERTGRNVLLIFADLDEFKDINDRFGHNEGDRALTEAARVIRGVFRDSDIIARLGGDEFVILALETSDLSGDILARRLREALAARNAQAQRGYAITMSVGVARYDPRSPAPIADLLARADALMYAHKQEKDSARRQTAARAREIPSALDSPGPRETLPIIRSTRQERINGG